MEIIANKYEVIKPLGEGGFGAVYLVRHLELGILYALKLIKNEKAKEEGFITRFKREAVVLSRLLHPNSIPLRDFGRTEEGYVYMAMDYCQGQSLQELLDQEGALEPQRVLNLTIQILDVMAEAHRLGIIHRDIKPDNIMLEEDSTGRDSVKVLDFGIARLAQDLEMGATMATVTQQGAIVGTPMYMSPEQVNAEDIDQRSDLYSLGMMLYELLTGQKPFEAKAPMQVLMCQLQQYPLPFAKLDLLYPLPKSVENLVLRAIQKEKTNRFQNAAQFKAACLQVQASLGQSGGIKGPTGIQKKASPAAISSRRVKTGTGSISQIQTGKQKALTTSGIGRISSSGRPLKSGSKFAATHPKSNPTSIIAVVVGILLVGLVGIFMFSPGDKQKKKKRTVHKGSSGRGSQVGSGSAPKPEIKKVSPKDFEELATKARLAFEDEDYGKSLQFLEKALSIREDGDLRKLLKKNRGYKLWKEGREYEKKGNFDQAILKLQEADKIIAKDEIASQLLRIESWKKRLDPLYNKGTILVAKTSDSSCHSIQQAIEKAPEYGRILILPGYYRRQLSIKKPLEIVGYGKGGEIVIQGEKGSTASVYASRAILRNLFFRGIPERRVDKLGGVTVGRGHVILESCQMAYFQGGLGVAPETKSLLLKRCKIFENWNNGVWMSGLKNITFENCEIFKNWRGINIYGSEVTFKNCLIHDNRELGVLFQERFKISMENCKILNHQSIQLRAYQGGELYMKGCTVRNGGSWGLVLDCNAVLLNCRINNNQEGGLVVPKSGRVEVNGCDLSNNPKGSGLRGKPYGLGGPGATIILNGTELRGK